MCAESDEIGLPVHSFIIYNSFIKKELNAFDTHTDNFKEMNLCLFNVVNQTHVCRMYMCMCFIILRVRVR